MWKRLTWPWTALRPVLTKPTLQIGNLSRQLPEAEWYLKGQFPDALIPNSLLNGNLRDSHVYLGETFSHAQGELLGLGITRYARVEGNGPKIGGQWKRLCIAFPSGELRTHISMLPM
jgi:hypothetical protein